MAVKSRVGSEFKSPKDSAGFMLWRVSNEWQREIREALKPLDLSHAQFVLLAATIWLEDQNLDVSQAVLSRHTVMDKMMVSDVVRMLEKKELLGRRQDPLDGRSLRIKATAKGVTLVQQAMKAVEKANQSFFSRSNVSNKKIVEVLHSLSSMDFNFP